MQDNLQVNPHDDHFKLIMDVKENVSEMIQAALPEQLVAKLDLESLQSSNTSFTDGKAGNYRADVVYQCKYGDGEDLTITLLFEHKSYKPAYPHIQLLQYLLGIWQSQIRNREKPGPVLPIVFYHGQQKWEYRSFFDYFKGGKIDPELQPYLPGFDFLFVNLQEKGDQWIVRNINSVALRISLLIMRNIKSPHLLGQLENLLDGIEELMKTEEGRKKTDQIFLYLRYGSNEPFEKIKEVMDHETYMSRPIPVGSTAWQIVQKAKVDAKAEGLSEGKTEGIAKGIAKGKTETAINLLKEGFNPAMVIKVTGLDSQTVKQLQKAHV